MGQISTETTRTLIQSYTTLVRVNWAAALILSRHVAMGGQRGTGRSVLDTDSPLILQ